MVKEKPLSLTMFWQPQADALMSTTSRLIKPPLSSTKLEYQSRIILPCRLLLDIFSLLVMRVIKSHYCMKRQIRREAGSRRAQKKARDVARDREINGGLGRHRPRAPTSSSSVKVLKRSEVNSSSSSAGRTCRWPRSTPRCARPCRARTWLRVR